MLILKILLILSNAFVKFTCGSFGLRVSIAFGQLSTFKVKDISILRPLYHN